MAIVQVSLIAFDNGEELDKVLDGTAVREIHANLTTGVNTTAAHRLPENRNLAFQGPVKVGKFEITGAMAHRMLRQPNPHGKPNSDVIKPWLNAHDMKYRPFGRYIIDFADMDEAEAALYESPFEHLKAAVKPERERNSDEGRRTHWWKLGRSGENFKSAKGNLKRFAITGRVGKHRAFLWVSGETVPDCEIVAFARSDDYFSAFCRALLMRFGREAKAPR